MSSIWPVVRLADVSTKVGSGATPKGGEASYQKDGVPFIRSMNVVFFGFKRSGLTYLNPEQAESLRGAEVRANDILLNITGASIGRVTRAPEDLDGARVNQHVCIIRPQESMEPRFLQAYLSSPEFQDLIKFENFGVTRQALTKGQILEFELPLPPLNEQRRIADKLDVLLAQVDACRERLDRVSAIVKRFRQAVLAAATSGRLTADWRARQGNGLEWQPSSLGNCGEVSGGLTKNSGRQGSELRMPYLRVANVYANRLNLEDVAEIGLNAKELAKTRLKRGDLLIVEGNGSIEQVGRVAIWNGELPECVHQNHLIRWRSAGAFPRYVLYWLLAPIGRTLLMELASSTTGLHTLSVSKVAAIPIDLPAPEEQQEIVRRVELLFSYADRLEQRIQATRARVERLTPALLAKAFRGELVPQDPNDESAEILLERLRQNASDGETKRRPGRKSSSR